MTTFYLKDCSLTQIALGMKAETLLEFRDKIAICPQSSLYTHFWGMRLGTHFEHSDFHNDFSLWAHAALHDDVLAERIDIINPVDFTNPEELRSRLIEVIERRLDERESIPTASRDALFHFVRSNIVVFDTSIQVNDPKELVNILPHSTPSSIFYHVIDARRRIPNKENDFCVWLEAFSPQYDSLRSKLCKIDPYFMSLKELKNSFIEACMLYG